MSVAEKVGLPNYSNVDVGPAVIERYVEDDPDAIRKALAEITLQCQELVFREAEEIRRRGQAPAPVTPSQRDITLERGLQLVSPNSGEVDFLDVRRLSALNKIRSLSETGKAAVRAKLVDLGAEKSTPALSLQALDAEGLSQLEAYINTQTQEGTHAPSA
jgi:hypothetical protein